MGSSGGIRIKTKKHSSNSLFCPNISGKIVPFNGASIVEIKLKPNWVHYLILAMLSIITLIFIFDPEMKINGELSDLSGRINFAIFFLLLLSFVCFAFSAFAFQLLKLDLRVHLYFEKLKEIKTPNPTKNLNR